MCDPRQTFPRTFPSLYDFSDETRRSRSCWRGQGLRHQRWPRVQAKLAQRWVDRGPREIKRSPLGDSSGTPTTDDRRPSTREGEQRDIKQDKASAVTDPRGGGGRGTNAGVLLTHKRLGGGAQVWGTSVGHKCGVWGTRIRNTFTLTQKLEENVSIGRATSR